jgi:hypothetical protein
LYVKEWVDQTMHSAVETIPTAVPGPATPVAFTSASTKTGALRRNYVVATMTSNVPYLNQNRPGGWSGWYSLPPLPSQFLHSSTHQNVGLTVKLDSSGEPHVWMAVASKIDIELNFTMYVSPNLVLGATPPWPTFAWTAAGSAGVLANFQGNPAIVPSGTLSTDRVDYFARGGNAIYYRWMFNGTWQSSTWQQVPQPPNGITIKSSPSAALKGDTIYIVARGSDDGLWMNTLPNVTNSATYGGPWTGWSPMGGGLLGQPAVTAWDHGVDLYAIGFDNRLYHRYMDDDGAWSDYIQLGATFTDVTALTASNLLPSTHEINVVGMVSGPPSSPRITRFPW